MEEDTTDTHLCLVCHCTVIGLDNYVKHKKKECVGRKNQPVVTSAVQEVAGCVATAVQAGSSPSKELAVSSATDTSNSALASPNTTHAIESTILMYHDTSPQDISITDFLSSLELQSRDPAPEQSKPNKDDSAEASNKGNSLDHKSLPITSILNDLEFSDDNEDDLPNIDTDNLMDLVDDDDHHPPRSHTGGKWRPAPPSGGKWKPSGKLLAMSKHRRSQQKQSSVGKRMYEDTTSKEEAMDQVEEEGTEDNNDQCDKPLTATETFSCFDCKRTYTRESGLTRHLLTNYHRRRAQASARENKARAESESEITSGTETEMTSPKWEEESAILECRTCDKEFNSKYNFARHLATDYHRRRSASDSGEFFQNESVQALLQRQKPYQCRICNFFCVDQDVFQEHLKHRNHKEALCLLVGPALCQPCNFSTRNSEEMVEHFTANCRAYKNGERFCIVREKRHQIKCQHCGLLVHSAAALKRHIQLSHLTPVKKVLRSENGVRVRPECPYCDLKCASQSALTLHIQRIHFREKKHKCEVCEKAFGDEHSLAFHKQTKYHYRRLAEASGLSLSDYLERARDENRLDASASLVLNSIHKKAQHQSECGEHEFNCKMCGLTFSSVQNLKTHIKSGRHKKMMETTESGTQIYECTDCGQKFDSPNSYVNHEMKVHTNIAKTEDGRPVRHVGIDEKYMEFLRNTERSKSAYAECPECGKTVSSNNMSAHLRRHSNTKPFTCQFCDSSFLDQTILKHHIA